MTMWGGRFSRPMDAAFGRFQRSYPFDRRLLPQELASSRAHARALGRAGVLSEEEVRSILGGLSQIEERANASPAFQEDEVAEDVHDFLERELTALIGDTGLKLHSGRSRNEQIATDLRLYVRQGTDRVQALLLDWLGALLARSEEAGGAAMPAYTHGQRAEPVLVSHWLLAYAAIFFRSAERLGECRRRANLCPLGSGAVAGTTLPLDRHALAADLGFDGPTSNSMDATSDREFALEFVSALALLAMQLSRWAEEMILFSTREYGFVSLPETYSTGSSAMPQKKNPDLLELTRGKAGRVCSDAVGMFICLKGLPLAYNKDLQETQEPLFDATETLVSLLPLVTGWMGAAEFHYDRMNAAADSGFLNAWAAATYLAERGVPFRLAHEQVGQAVQRCLERGCELRDLPLEELRGFNAHFGDDVYPRLALPSVLGIHDVVGGTAPARVREALVTAREKLRQLRTVLDADA